MSRTARSIAITALMLLGGTTGCGVEALFQEGFDNEYEPPASIIRGTSEIPDPQIVVTTPEGTQVALTSSSTSGTSFELVLPGADYENLRLVATRGEQMLQALVPTLAFEGTVSGVAITRASTTETFVVDTKASAEGRDLVSLSPDEVIGARSQVREAFEEDGLAQDLLQMVGRLVDAGDPAGDTLMFQTLTATTSTTGDYRVTTSPINAGWLQAASVDYDGDGAADDGTALFDAVLAMVAQETLFGCLDPDNLRVVFAVRFQDGMKNGNCGNINRFKWVRDEPGKRMFFVGGLHEDSPVQDSEIDAMLGNPSGWVPNQVMMFDDGTNGDEEAGDNIWTRTFILPKGARVGYKYTWGKQGDLWTGSEEWPGNQRLLEVVDVNGDDIVYRIDNFGDEATNKDKVNLNRNGNGNVTWDTDNNEDGIPDARERMVDLDNDCVLDEWMTPTGVGPATVDCATLEDQ